MIDDDKPLKIILVGDSDIGKTCLMIRFCENYFEESPILSIGVDFKNKIFTVDGLQVKLQLWDTAGRERFREISKCYYKNADGILILCDASSSIEDFKSLVSIWGKDLKGGSIPVIVVGNKIDKENIIPKEEAEEITLEMGFPYFEMSIKENKGIDDAFSYLARAAYHNCLRSQLLK